MLATVVILVSSVLVALLIGGLYSRRKLPRLTFLPTLVALVLLVTGTGLVYNQDYEIRTAVNRKEWPQEKGKIIKTEITGERAFQPAITYSYTVDEKSYKTTTDLSTPGFGGKRSRKDTAQKILDEYAIGTEVDVYYNPDNPRESFLHPGPIWSDYMKLGFGIVVFSFGFFGLASSIVARFQE